MPALSLVPEELMPPEAALMARKEPTGPSSAPSWEHPGEPGLCYQPIHPLQQGVHSPTQNNSWPGREMRLHHVCRVSREGCQQALTQFPVCPQGSGFTKGSAWGATR